MRGKLGNYVSRNVNAKGVFGRRGLNFSPVTSDVWILIRRTKHKLITKLIAEPLG